MAKPDTLIQPCLRCRRPFESEGAHHRLCMLCANKTIGDGLGFRANYLRAAFAVGMFFSFWTALAVYLAIGAVVLASRRLIYRDPRRPQPAPVVATTAETTETVPMPKTIRSVS
ncbi:zinc finger domain-containing protein [Sphingobium nicotianae]|uniref:Zinc finger FPG/IleRS-type domain-containing protein n=1 Tax=Sphingobium nicotianae TaxID=2782607 RepID=A0A9X1DDV3_9SPHN|nr:zinc finger domain-containing protein [Sphingobium nicotianae]MBT2188372.1 hypothetical protein [Sphingobium nicotianae]